MGARPRVLIPLQWFGAVGGIEVFILNLLPFLVERFEVGIAVQRMDNRALSLPFPPGVQVYELDLWPQRSSLTAVLDDFQPHVVHLQAIGSPGLLRLGGLAAGRGVPLAWTIHQVPENFEWYVPFVGQPLWLGYRMLAARCAQVVAPSPYIAKLAAEHGIKAEVISCGVDRDRFRPGDKMAARLELGLADRPTVLFVGRLGREKNGWRLLMAMERLTRTCDAQLVMVGPAAESVRTHFLAGRAAQRLLERGALVLPGSVPHDSVRLPLYFQAADVFALPSLFETQSIATLEALASGLPALVSDRAALVDLVRPGVNGRLCSPTHISDITGQLSALLDDRLSAPVLGAEHAPSWASEQYTRLYLAAVDAKKRPKRAFWPTPS